MRPGPHLFGMRRALFLIPLVVCGCRPGRQAAVSSDGRVASTIESGTFIAGRGKVAEGGQDVAWSPDGQTLAISAEGGLLLWPKGEKFAGLSSPFAWSPFGDQIAATAESGVRVKNILTGELKPTSFTGKPHALHWTQDGRLFAIDAERLQIDGGAALERKDKMIFDAVPIADGTITWLETDDIDRPSARLLTAAIRLGHWNPTDGAVTVSNLPDAGRLFGSPSPRKIFVPSDFSLSPDGSQFAAAGFQIETSARGITRLRALAEKVTNLTKAENTEADTILKGARISDLVVKVSTSGQTDTLWTSLVEKDKLGPTDLAWSPDGKWLAIARKDGTVRIAAQ